MNTLYEDDGVLAVCKPEGVATIPAAKGGPSAVEILSAERGAKLFVVHRLDKGVSGALLFAKNTQAHRELNLKFQNREVGKYYLAVLCGVPQLRAGALDAPLRQFGSGRTGVDVEKGKPCRTEYEVLGERNGLCLVKIRLITGRRHQIRAHFCSVGCPVAGDTRYGDQSKQRAFSRLLLHSWRIELELFGKKLAVSAPVPESFMKEARKAGLAAFLP